MKKIIVSIDDKPFLMLEIEKGRTLGDIITTANNQVKNKGLNPDNYNLSLKYYSKEEGKERKQKEVEYIIQNEILKDEKYYGISPYEQFSENVESYLNYSSHALSNWNKDVLAILFSQMDPISINNFCQSSKSLLQLCEEENFWRKVAIQKYGVSISNSPYPSWKSYVLDTLSLNESSETRVKKYAISIQIRTSDLPVLDYKYIHITKYTPLRLFIDRVFGKYKNFTGVFTDEDKFKYNYYDLDSLPLSAAPFSAQTPKKNFDVLVRNSELNLDILPSVGLNTTQPFLWKLPTYINYFNNWKRYTDKGVTSHPKEKEVYLPKFVLVRPYISLDSYKKETKEKCGICLVGVEFRLGKFPKGWCREFIFTSATLNEKTNEYEVSFKRFPESHPDYIFPNYYYQDVLNSLFK